MKVHGYKEVPVIPLFGEVISTLLNAARCKSPQARIRSKMVNMSLSFAALAVALLSANVAVAAPYKKSVDIQAHRGGLGELSRASTSFES